MEKEQYLAYREEKCKQFLESVRKIFKNRTEEEIEMQMKAIEFGFKKGMDTATKGGKYVHL